MTITDELKEKQEKLLKEALENRQVNSSVEAENETVELVVFTLNGDCYALESGNIKEILPYSPVTSIPGCPDAILGVVNVRGNIESVISLHQLLGLTGTAPTTLSKILLTHSGTIRSGILVDSIEDVIRVDKKRIKPPLSTLSSTLKSFSAGGETLYRDHYVTVLEINNIFQGIVQ